MLELKKKQNDALQLEGTLGWCWPCSKGVIALEFLSARLGKERLGLGFAGVLVSQSVDLLGARAHDAVGWRDVLVSLLVGHLGMKGLTVVLHTLDILEGWLLSHGSVDVLIGENLGRHDESVESSKEVEVCMMKRKYGRLERERLTVL
jgi:hypothetical protein